MELLARGYFSDVRKTFGKSSSKKCCLSQRVLAAGNHLLPLCQHGTAAELYVRLGEKLSASSLHPLSVVY